MSKAHSTNVTELDRQTYALLCSKTDAELTLDLVSGWDLFESLRLGCNGGERMEKILEILRRLAEAKLIAIEKPDIRTMKIRILGRES